MMENKSPIPPGNKLPGYLGVFFIVETFKHRMGINNCRNTDSQFICTYSLVKNTHKPFNKNERMHFESSEFFVIFK